jgi:oxygen-independent coproporphyrinogen-3 oxidase
VNESAAGIEDGRGLMRHVAGAEQITRTLAISDELILGLRLIEGVSREAFAGRYGCDPRDVYADVIDEFVGYGLLAETSTHLRLTRRGRLLSNELFQRLLPAPEAATA